MQARSTLQLCMSCSNTQFTCQGHLCYKRPGRQNKAWSTLLTTSMQRGGKHGPGHNIMFCFIRGPEDIYVSVVFTHIWVCCAVMLFGYLRKFLNSKTSVFNNPLSISNCVFWPAPSLQHPFLSKSGTPRFRHVSSEHVCHRDIFT